MLAHRDHLPHGLKPRPIQIGMQDVDRLCGLGDHRSPGIHDERMAEHGAWLTIGGSVAAALPTGSKEALELDCASPA